jgi:hypothetical protein
LKREYLAIPAAGLTIGYGPLVFRAGTSGLPVAWMTLAIVSVALAVLFAIAVSRLENRFAEAWPELTPGPEDVRDEQSSR